MPETTTYKNDSSDEMVVNNGFRRIVPYIGHVQGGEIKKQALRIRQLFIDFDADYISLDTRNAGSDAVQTRKRFELLVRKKRGR